MSRGAGTEAFVTKSADEQHDGPTLLVIRMALVGVVAHVSSISCACAIRPVCGGVQARCAVRLILFLMSAFMAPTACGEQSDMSLVRSAAHLHTCLSKHVVAATCGMLSACMCKGEAVVL